MCSQMVSAAGSDHYSPRLTPEKAEAEFVVFVEIVSCW